MSKFWDQLPNALLLLPRGKIKTSKYREIIIETLRQVSPVSLTKDELQKRAHIKRSRFIIVLKDLVEAGTVEKLGTGTRADPFKYRLRTPVPILPTEIPVS